LSCSKKKAERYAELRKLYELRRRERIKKFQGLNVYIKNIEDHVSDEVLRKVFEPYGTIENLTIMKEKGVSKGFGFVCFSTPEEAQRAITEIGKNKILPGCSKPLYVAIHESREIRQQRFSRVRNPKMNQQQMYPNQVYYPSGFNMMRPGGGQNWTGQPNMQQIPPGGYMPQTGGRGGRGGRGRGGGRGGSTTHMKIDVNEISQLPQNRQKEILGELLLKRIEEKDPINASKITGMIVHSQDYTPESVTELINEDDKLDKIVREARSFLEQQQQGLDQTEEEVNE